MASAILTRVNAAMKIGPMLALVCICLPVVLGPAGHAQGPAPPGVDRRAHRGRARASCGAVRPESNRWRNRFQKTNRSRFCARRRSSPAASTPKPSRSCSRSPRKNPPATPRSSSVCCSSISAAAAKRGGRCSCCCSASAPAPRARDYARAARAARALGPLRRRQRALPRGESRWRPTIAPINTAWGDLFLEKHNRAGSARNRTRRRSRPIPTTQPALARHWRKARRRRQPAGGDEIRAARARAQSQRRRRRTSSSPSSRSTTTSATRRAPPIAKAQAINPNSLEAHALQAAIAFVEGKDAEYQGSDRRGAQDQSALRRGLSRRRRGHGAQYYRFDEAVEQVRRGIAIDRENARAHADLGAHLMRTGDERNARRALEIAFRADPFDVITFNLLELLDTLDTLPDRSREGDLVIKLHADEIGGDARVRAGARAGGARRAQQALGLHAEGSDPDRGVPAPRRLRRAQRRAARA